MRVLDVELVAAVVVIDVTGNWLVELMEKWTGRLVNDIGIIWVCNKTRLSP